MQLQIPFSVQAIIRPSVLTVRLRPPHFAIRDRIETAEEYEERMEELTARAALKLPLFPE